MDILKECIKSVNSLLCSVWFYEALTKAIIIITRTGVGDPGDTYMCLT